VRGKELKMRERNTRRKKPTEKRRKRKEKLLA
jgi:hypothetical protein